MANTIEHHLKLIAGDLLITLAKLSAENEALRENQRPPRKPKPDAKP